MSTADSIDCDSLGSIQDGERAEKVTLPVGALPAPDREAYMKVTAYLAANPNATPQKACEAIGIPLSTWTRARRRMEAGESDAFSFSDRDLIRKV